MEVTYCFGTETLVREFQDHLHDFSHTIYVFSEVLSFAVLLFVCFSQLKINERKIDFFPNFRLIFQFSLGSLCEWELMGSSYFRPFMSSGILIDCTGINISKYI